MASGGAAAPAVAAKPKSNLFTLRVNNRDFSGWSSVRVTRRLIGCPSDFDISLTERFPGRPDLIAVEAGQPCTILLGPDPVMTGWIDRYSASISPTQHEVRVQGRSKCEDIVDCMVTSDQITGMQIICTNLLDLATDLCKPYGITVTSLTGDKVPVSLPGGAPLQFNAVLTETPFEIIERVARFAGVLVYDDGNGNLVLANVGTSSHSSGFAEGVNVQAAAVSYSMDGRFSEYLPVLMNVNFYSDKGGSGTQSFPKVFDEGVGRFRQRIIVSEQMPLGQSFATKRAQWEAARRAGLSQSVHITCDNWRDSEQILWQPNAFAPIVLPTLKLTPANPWVIGEVTYSIDPARGTTAELLVMPRDAFLPEPTILTPFLYDPGSSPSAGGGGAAATPRKLLPGQVET